jgi:hypothetical protein
MRQESFLKELGKKLEKHKSMILDYESNIHSLSQNVREYFFHLREIWHLYEDVVREFPSLFEKEKTFQELKKLSGQALEKLRGQPEISPLSLKDYDYERFGPFLGVSDDGLAAEDIVNGVFESPKAVALGRNGNPLSIGVALDAERLVAIGEVVAGPKELCKIRLECAGRILNSMNVGSRINHRNFKTIPPIYIPGEDRDAEESFKASLSSLKKLIQPFLENLNPKTILAEFKYPSQPKRDKIYVLKKLGAWMKENCNHLSLGLLVNIDQKLTKKVRFSRKKSAKLGIDLAWKSGIAEVAFAGMPRQASSERVSMPGLLQFFCTEDLLNLFEYADSKGVSRLRPFNYVDTETIARHVWSGLNSARCFGLDLGKYGLFPLTFEESDHVMEQIQSWFPDWTAAPVYYVDVESLGENNMIYTNSKKPSNNPRKRGLFQGILDWLTMVGKRRIPVVLIDTVEKAEKMRILKLKKSDSLGFLDLEDINRINQHAKDNNVKVLWAGGLTQEQAYEMGKLGVFGIFVTSAASIKVPISNETKDIALTQRLKPTKDGVQRTKTFIEAGFLGMSMNSPHQKLVEAWQKRFGIDQMKVNRKTRA